MIDNNDSVSRETMTGVPVFVYGSLRPRSNGANGMLANAAIAGPWEAYVPGELFYHECGAYPVMDCDGEQIVRGDMYLVDESHESWQWLIKMETEAGYWVRWCPVVARQSDGSWGESKAIVFDWPYGTERLERVAGNDWLLAEWRPWPMRGVR